MTKDQIIKAGTLVEVLTVDNRWNYIGRVNRVTNDMRPMPTGYVPVTELGAKGGLLIHRNQVRVVDNAA